MSDIDPVPAPDADAATLTEEPADERAATASGDEAQPIGPADGAMPSRDDLPTSGELDAAPLDGALDEATERSAEGVDVGSIGAAGGAVAAEVAAVHAKDDGAQVVVDAAPAAAAVDGAPAEDMAADVDAMATTLEEGGVDPARAGMAVDPNVAMPPVSTTPEPMGAEADAAVDEAADELLAEADDDLDDLLGMAGVDADGIDEAAAVTDESPTPVAAEAEEAPAPAITRPTSLEQVQDQRDLRRMKGQWFVVHTYSGYEQRVKDNLNARVEALDAHDRIFEVHIPTQDVTEFKKGKKQTVAKKFLPGYVLVRMRMDDETWGIVRHTPNVTGFVGSSGSRPAPLSMREVASTLSIPARVEPVEDTGSSGYTGEVVPEKPEIEIDLDVGETIRVTTGPFADFTGTIAEINVDQAKLKVLVSVFGRETPIELPFDNVAKL